MSLSSDAEDLDPRISPTPPIEVHYHLPEEELHLDLMLPMGLLTPQ